jgi:hypothetical protein
MALCHFSSETHSDSITNTLLQLGQVSRSSNGFSDHEFTFPTKLFIREG